MTSETDLDAIAADLDKSFKMNQKVGEAVDALRWLRMPENASLIRTKVERNISDYYMSDPVAGYIARAGEKFAAQIIETARAEAQSVVNEYMHDGEAT